MKSKIIFNTISQPKYFSEPSFSDNKIFFSLFPEGEPINSPKLVDLISKNYNYIKNSFDLQNIFNVDYNEKPISMSSLFQMLNLNNEDFLNSININCCFDMNNNIKEIKNLSDINFLRTQISKSLEENSEKISIDSAEIQKLDIAEFNFNNKENETIIDKINKMMGNNYDYYLSLNNDPDKNWKTGIFARQIRVSGDDIRGSFNFIFNSSINNIEIKLPKNFKKNIKIECRNLFKYSIIRKTSRLTMKDIHVSSSSWTPIKTVSLIDKTPPNKITDLSVKFLSNSKSILTWNCDSYEDLAGFKIQENDSEYILDSKTRFKLLQQEKNNSITMVKIFAFDRSNNFSEITSLFLDYKNKKTRPISSNVVKKQSGINTISNGKNVEVVFYPDTSQQFNNLEINIKDIEKDGSTQTLSYDKSNITFIR